MTGPEDKPGQRNPGAQVMEKEAILARPHSVLLGGPPGGAPPGTQPPGSRYPCCMVWPLMEQDEVEGHVMREGPTAGSGVLAKLGEGRNDSCCPQAGALSAEDPATVNPLSGKSQGLPVSC